ncbi:MAG: DHA2 family efflux MFS transporter permease subunit [Rhabdochlamydiaceae bacterium]|nr:DHA2 family efflux MFS transporter permease subunit [Rhabdochlamydiaceae bacterium]
MTPDPYAAEKKPGILFALFFTLFMVIFNFTMTNMAAIYIVGDLGGSNDTASYTISIFAVGNALGVPFGRALYERIGTMRLFVICMLLFAFFSLLCPFAATWASFLSLRFIQGLVAGPLYILTARMISVLGPADKKDLFTICMLAIFILVPALGASCGAWIAYDLHWRWIFYFDVPILLMLVGYLKLRLNNFDRDLKKVPFDVVGYVFLFLGIFNISLALITGQELDWFRSSLITWMFAIGVLSLIFFILWDLNHPNPILWLSLLKKPIFAFALINLVVLFSAYFGAIILLALWLGLYVNYTPIWIGILIGTMAIAGLVPIFLATDRFGHRDARLSLLVGVVLLGISCFHSSIFNEEVNFGRIAFSRIIAGFGIAFFLPPIFRLCFRTFKEQMTPKVIGLFQVVRCLGSGLGASIYTTLWQRRQVFYHDRLGSQLTIYSPETQQYFADAAQFHITGKKADAHLADLLQRQATSLALDDCFWLMGWICAGLGILILFTLFFNKKPFLPEHQEPQECPAFEET